MLPGVDDHNVLGMNGLDLWNSWLSVDGPRETSNPRCTVLSWRISFEILCELAWDVIMSSDRTEET